MRISSSVLSQLRRFVVHVPFFLFLNFGFSSTFSNFARKHENFVCIVELQHKFLFFCSFPYWFNSFWLSTVEYISFCRKCMLGAFYVACPICYLFIHCFSGGLECFFSYFLWIYFSQHLSFSSLPLMLFCQSICCVRI